MRFIKKLTIQLEDENGNIESSDIEGLYVTSIDVEQKFEMRVNPWERYTPKEPIEVTIKLEAWGGMWVGVSTQNQQPRQLSSKQNQLPEHEDESRGT